jgi:hypothetical protein
MLRICLPKMAIWIPHEDLAPRFLGLTRISLCPHRTYAGDCTVMVPPFSERAVVGNIMQKTT